jgi:hypothetical protein
MKIRKIFFLSMLFINFCKLLAQSNDMMKPLFQAKFSPEINYESQKIKIDSTHLCTACNLLGVRQNVAIDIIKDGTWNTAPDGRRYCLYRIKMNGAGGIDMVFEQFIIPEGGRLFILNSKNKIIRGPYTALDKGDSTNFIIPRMSYNDIVIEYDEPQNNYGNDNIMSKKNSSPQAKLNILKLGYIIPTDFDYFGAASSCTINVNCHHTLDNEDWCKEVRAVAEFDFQRVGDPDHIYFCSGTLLNNSNQDFTPYFMTAYHCVHNADLANAIFYFNWQSPTCASQQNGTNQLFIKGATLLAGVGNDNTETTTCPDMALLLLSRRPPLSFNVYYSGWDNTYQPSFKEPNDNRVFCISHPRGDQKKICEGNTFDFLGDCFFKIFWFLGTIERGSSGGGLFDEGHKFFGTSSSLNVQHSAEEDALCPPNAPTANFGAFHGFWDNVKNYLAPNNTTLTSLDGIDPMGDANGCHISDETISEREILPALRWQYQNLIKVQTSHSITLGTNLIHGGTSMNDSGEYIFQSGTQIAIKAPFRTLYDNNFSASRMQARIHACEPVNNCGFNFTYENRALPDNSTNAGYSGPTSLGAGSAPESTVKIYPNPSSRSFNVEYSLTESENVEISMQDLLGREVSHISYQNKEAGMHTEELRVPDLAQGIYTVIIRANSVNGQYKVIKVN